MRGAKKKETKRLIRRALLLPVRSNFTQISFKCQNACCTNASNAKSGPPAINHHAQIFESRSARSLDTFAPWTALFGRVKRQKPVDRHESNFWLQSTDLLTALRSRLARISKSVNTQKEFKVSASNKINDWMLPEWFRRTKI